MSLKVDALRAKYIAMRLESIATLEVYMQNAAGIGEHPQIIEEMDNLVRVIADVNGYIEVLDTVFTSTDEGSVLGQAGPINE